MADFYHGVSTRQVETSVSTPVEADSGVPFVVGTAPVHTVGGKVNVPILAYTYEEAVTALGFSDNWENYTLSSANVKREVHYCEFLRGQPGGAKGA